MLFRFTEAPELINLRDRLYSRVIETFPQPELIYNRAGEVAFVFWNLQRFLRTFAGRQKCQVIFERLMVRA